MAARPILYYAQFSPPSRACLLTLKLINLNIETKSINFAKQEHHSDWFLKINPRHTVPVLVDGGVSVSDSHAIVTYLIDQYGQEEHEHLYPKNLLKRAIVNERLYYENGVLFQAAKDFAARIFYGGEISYNNHSKKLCHNAYKFLEEFLNHSNYVAGDQLTVADVSINTSLITLDKLVPVEEQRYPKIHTWIERMKNELPDYKMNETGAQQLFQRFEDSLIENMTKHS